MADYHIAMGQALVLNNLNGNTIYTGPQPIGNALRSCSAIIMVNTVTGVGGLYHKPAEASLGSQARTIIDDMNTMIQPNEIWLYYGNAVDHGSSRATDLSDLSSYLLNIVPHINNRPASTGAVSVSINAGVPQINTNQMNITGANNLTNHGAGAIPGIGGHLFM